MLGDTIIVNFHGIGEPDRPVPDDEKPYWISEARYESILDRIADARDRRRYLITFDDGNMSDVTIGLPGLRRRGLTATFFVLAGMLDEHGFLESAAFAWRTTPPPPGLATRVGDDVLRGWVCCAPESPIVL